MGLYDLVDRLERVEALEGVAVRTQQGAAQLLPSGTVKNLLSGSWFGHPLHPTLIVVPIGSWVSGTVLDLTGGKVGRAAADRLIVLGILSSLPTAASGLSDWIDLKGSERRIGLVHALGNYAALGLMLASWRARKRGRRATGVLLALAANGLVGVTGYLGGHLAYNQGVGVDTTAFEGGPQEWTPIAQEADLHEGEPLGADAGGVMVLLLRRDAQVHAIAARCTHRGGPLHEGKLEDGCIVCPWHGSAFDPTDGRVASGPATQPQPVYETRVRNGKVEVRRTEVRSLRANPV